jgi:NADPH2:quinone reductase
LAAVDVGRALGFDVIAVASTPEKRALATARGARATIDSSAGDPATVKSAARELGEGGVNAVYDPVGGELGTECLRALNENGQHLVIGFAAGAIPRLPANQILLSNRRVIGVDLGGWLAKHPEDQPDMLAELFGLVEAGQLTPVEPAAYPLDEAAEALAAQHGRAVAGKTVLIP